MSQSTSHYKNNLAADQYSVSITPQATIELQKSIPHVSAAAVSAQFLQFSRELGHSWRLE